VAVSQATMNSISTLFGVTLTTPFYSSDTNGDGVVDSFTDPNGVLTSIHVATIGGNASFLISTDGSGVPDFFWDTRANTITPITYTKGTVTADPIIDTTDSTVTFTVSVEKGNWIYLDITDFYPPEDFADYSVVIKTTDGRIISPDLIWRENGKIHMLDDATIQYDVIYEYSILPPDFDPISGTVFDTNFTPPNGIVFNIARPTVHIVYHEAVTIVAATLNTIDARSFFHTSDNKAYIFTPTIDLTSGTYTLSITAQDASGNRLTTTASYIVRLPKEAASSLPWLYIIIAIIAIIVVIVLIIVALMRSGHLYVEQVDDKDKKNK
jgi:hypothetical protein